MDINLNTYPGQADIDLLDSLHDRDVPFIVWANGGNPSGFRFSQRGWRLKDVYQMQTLGGASNGYANNIFIMGVDADYSFVEVS